MTLSVPQETQASPAAHKSLGLKALLDWMRGDRCYSILDLGPAVGGNVRFWSQFSCWLHIRDFYRSYREWKAAAGPEKDSAEAALSVLLPFNDEAVFDVILAWDLFNHLELRELEALVQRLCRWCRPGTKFFALISSLPNISASPTTFRIINRERILYDMPTQDMKPGPNYQPRDIARLMARFAVSSSFLLRQGIREYVFVFK
jgi:Methyltransferase domain